MRGTPLPRLVALVDRRLFVYPAPGMAAVVNARLDALAFERAVDRILPCRPPRDDLLLAVPTRRDRVLPAIAGSLLVLRYALQSLCLRVASELQRRHGQHGRTSPG